MGNKANRSLQVAEPSRPGQWVREGTTGYSDIVRNPAQGIVGELYTIPVDNRIRHEEDLFMYEFRRTQDINLVKVYKVERENAQFMCQGNEFQRVITEHIPKRLSEVKLDEIEGLYVLQEALIGFKTIQDHRPKDSFNINDDMIGFTPEGKVRVWLNENFAKNLPDHIQKVQHRYDEHAYTPHNDTVLLDQIYDVVEEHIVTNKYPEKFRNMYTQNPPNSFAEAISLVRSYTHNFHANMPQAVSSVASKIGAQSVQSQSYVGAVSQGYQPVSSTVVSNIASVQPRAVETSQQVMSVAPTQNASRIGGVSSVPASSVHTSLPPSNSRIIILNNATRPITSAPSGSRLIIQQPVQTLSQSQVHGGGSRVIVQGGQGAPGLAQTVNLSQLRQQEWLPVQLQNTLQRNRSSSVKILPGVNQSFNATNFAPIQQTHLNHSLGSILSRQQTQNVTTASAKNLGPIQFTQKISSGNSSQTKLQKNVVTVNSSAFNLPQTTTTGLAAAKVQTTTQQPLVFGTKKQSTPAQVKTFRAPVNVTGFKAQTATQSVQKNIQVQTPANQPAQVIQQTTAAQPAQKTEAPKVTEAPKPQTTTQSAQASGTTKVQISGPRIIRVGEKANTASFESAQKTIKVETQGPGTPGFKESVQLSSGQRVIEGKIQQIPIHRVIQGGNVLNKDAKTSVPFKPSQVTQNIPIRQVVQQAQQQAAQQTSQPQVQVRQGLSIGRQPIQAQSQQQTIQSNSQQGQTQQQPQPQQASQPQTQPVSQNQVPTQVQAPPQVQSQPQSSQGAQNAQGQVHKPRIVYVYQEPTPLPCEPRQQATPAEQEQQLQEAQQQVVEGRVEEVITISEQVVTVNEQGEPIVSHEEIITTQIDQQGNPHTTGVVIDHQEEGNSRHGVTYATTEVRDYTVGYDQDGNPYINSENYAYSENPVKEYEKYIDSTTGVETLQNYRYGDGSPVRVVNSGPVGYHRVYNDSVPQDYQQFVSREQGNNVAYRNYRPQARGEPPVPSYQQLRNHLNNAEEQIDYHQIVH